MTSIKEEWFELGRVRFAPEPNGDAPAVFLLIEGRSERIRIMWTTSHSESVRLAREINERADCTTWLNNTRA